MRVLERVERGELKRVMVFMPPRHGKSELVSRLFAAWFLTRHPHWFVGLASYGQDHADRLSRAAQFNFLANGGKLTSTNVRYWTTPEGGGLWCAGVGGPITGSGAHVLIVDDPIKDAEQANSPTVRETLKEWYQAVFSTREEPWSDEDQTAAVIIVQTRWHDDDLAGFLLEEEKACAENEEDAERWHIVCMEGLKEADPPKFPASCTLEPDERQVGEALCPERRSVRWLERLKRKWRAGYWWAALYQQRPKAADGTYFLRQWWRYRSDRPELEWYLRCWDTSLTKGGDKWGTVLAGVIGRKIVVFHAEKFQADTPEGRKRIKEIQATDPPNTVLAIEKSTASLNLIQDLAEDPELQGVTVIPVPVPGKSKLARAMGFIHRLAVGEVEMVKDSSWNSVLVEEGVAFKNRDGDEDCLVDCLSVFMQAAFTLKGGTIEKKPEFKPGSVGAYNEYFKRKKPDVDGEGI